MSDQTPEVPTPGEMPPPGAMPPPGSMPPPPPPAAVYPPPPAAYPPPPPAFPAAQYGAPQYGNMPSVGFPTMGMPSSAYTNWGLRVVSYLVDGVVSGVFFGIGSVIDGPRAVIAPSGMVSTTGGGVIYWLFWLIGVAVTIWNIVLRQGKTGQSIGKQVVGTQCLKESTMAPLGAGMQFARLLAHILDGFCLIGYLWPIWDAKRQTFADKIVGTVVVAKPKS